jgi:hypothetical protein
MDLDEPIARWHAVAASRDAAAIAALIADDAVFESPVVHTPQRGKDITVKYLVGASFVLGTADFRYVGEWRSGHSAVLEFTTEIDGITINGVDMIRWNEAGLIVHFKVMVRPLKAMTMLHEKMGAMLQSFA